MRKRTESVEPTAQAVLDVVAGRCPARAGVDWDHFGELLHYHGLAGLAMADSVVRERAGEDPGLPELVRAQLRVAYVRTALHSTLVIESGERAMAVLRAAGLPALRFKGTALLTDGTYPDPGARPVEDTDILVRPEDAAEAVLALRKANFAEWGPWRPSQTTWLASFSMSDGGGAAGIHPDLDLHWATPYGRLRLSDPWPPDPLWTASSDGRPAPEPHFALIAEHVLKHLRVVAHLRGIADLVRLAPSLTDGAFLEAQGRERGSLRGLRLLLAFLQDSLSVHVPEDVVHRLRPPSELPARVARRLSTARLVDCPVGTPMDRAGGILGDWSLIATPAESVREILRVLAPPDRWLRARYPDIAGPLRRRARYMGAVVRWVGGIGSSPLSPNQEAVP